MTVLGLGAVGSGGRGVPGSVKRRQRNQREVTGEGSRLRPPQTGMACSGWVGECGTHNLSSSPKPSPMSQGRGGRMKHPYHPLAPLGLEGI